MTKHTLLQCWGVGAGRSQKLPWKRTERLTSMFSDRPWNKGIRQKQLRKVVDVVLWLMNAYIGMCTHTYIYIHKLTQACTTHLCHIKRRTEFCLQHRWEAERVEQSGHIQMYPADHLCFDLFYIVSCWTRLQNLF